jgi:hypothetical protein
MQLTYTDESGLMIRGSMYELKDRTVIRRGRNAHGPDQYQDMFGVLVHVLRF